MGGRSELSCMGGELPRASAREGRSLRFEELDREADMAVDVGARVKEGVAFEVTGEGCEDGKGGSDAISEVEKKDEYANANDRRMT